MRPLLAILTVDHAAHPILLVLEAPLSVGVVAAARVPVARVVFLPIPCRLGGYPGEPRPYGALVGQHIT